MIKIFNIFLSLLFKKKSLDLLKKDALEHFYALRKNVPIHFSILQTEEKIQKLIKSNETEQALNILASFLEEMYKETDLKTIHFLFSVNKYLSLYSIEEYIEWYNYISELDNELQLTGQNYCRTLLTKINLQITKNELDMINSVNLTIPKDETIH